jgi:hypothetical protein
VDDSLRSAEPRGARYLLIGGFAVIARTTKDIDFLFDASAHNVARVKSALVYRTGLPTTMWRATPSFAGPTR